MFDNVVVGVKDFEGDRDALWLAKALASGKARLTLVHVQVVKHRPAPDSGAAGYAARRRYATERLAALRDESQLEAEIVCSEALSVRQGLHDAARTRHADLLVIGASRQDELYRDLVGDIPRLLLEGAPCAVAVAPLGCSDRRAPLRHIGVGYDGSARSAQAVAVARRLATDRHARLSAFHAVAAPVYAHDPWNVDGEIDERVEEARQEIEKLGGVEAQARYGDPAEQLLRYEGSVDLLVLGSHKHRLIDAREQRTAQRLADEGSCPLLVLSNNAAAVEPPS